MIQGMRIGATLIALSLALFTLNALGVSAAAGVQLSAAGLSESTAQDTVGELKQGQVEGVGQQDPGFFGVAAAMLRTVSQLWTLVAKTSAILQSVGTPWPIAHSVQIMVDFTFVYGLYQIARGVNF